MDPGPPSPPPPLEEYLDRFDIPKPKPSCRPSLQYWPVASFSCETIKPGSNFCWGEKMEAGLSTLWLDERRLIHIFKRRPTRYTCGMPPRCILLTFILLVFKMMRIVMMTIFTILIIRSGLVPSIFKRRLEGYGRTECAPSYARKIAYQATTRMLMLMLMLMLMVQEGWLNKAYLGIILNPCHNNDDEEDLLGTASVQHS